MLYSCSLLVIHFKYSSEYTFFIAKIIFSNARYICVYHMFFRGRLEFIDFRSYEIAKTKVIFIQGNVPLAKNTDILKSLLYSFCCIHFHLKKITFIKKKSSKMFFFEFVVCRYFRNTVHLRN